MAAHEETFSTPRSAVGFAIAVTFAVATLWVAGLVVEIHSYSAAAPAHNATAQVVSTPCSTDGDDAVQCVRLRVEP